MKAEVVHKELSPEFCWFHPRVAAIPGAGKDGRPAVVMTIQKHLVASDHYSGMYFLRTDDLGQTWTGPTEIPELAWQLGENDETIAVCDVTPGWHAPSRKLLAIGIKLRYSKDGRQLVDKPRSHECAYATYDPQSQKWTSWKMLAMPETDGKFFLVAPGCVQWLVNSDGTLLLPIYFKGQSGDDYIATVLHCSFDGQELKYLKHGDELAIQGGRGFCEPSLALHQGTYFLTLRNDTAAYVTTSTDGLHFQPVKKWTFDDGQDLGSYNTQAHWLTHSEATLPDLYAARSEQRPHPAESSPDLRGSGRSDKTPSVAQDRTVTLAGTWRDARQLRRGGDYAGRIVGHGRRVHSQRDATSQRRRRLDVAGTSPMVKAEFADRVSDVERGGRPKQCRNNWFDENAVAATRFELATCRRGDRSNWCESREESTRTATTKNRGDKIRTCDLLVPKPFKTTLKTRPFQCFPR